MEVEIAARDDHKSRQLWCNLEPGMSVTLRRRESNRLNPEMIDAYLPGGEVQPDAVGVWIGFIGGHDLGNLPALMDSAGKRDVVSTYLRSRINDFGITWLTVSVDHADLASEAPASSSEAGRRPRRQKPGSASAVEIWI